MNEKFNVYFFNKVLYYGLTILILGLAIFVFSLIGLFSLFIQLFKSLLPVFLAIFIAYILEPIFQYLENKRIKRIISVPVVYLIIVAFFALALYFLIPNILMQIKDFFVGLPELVTTIDEMIIKFTKDYHIDFEIKDIIDKFLSNATITLIDLFNRISSSIMTVLIATTGAILLSLDFIKFKKGFKMLIPSKYKGAIINYLRQVLPYIHRYTIGLIIDNILFFFIATIVFWLAGAKYPFLFSLIIALTNFIPIIGQFIGGIPIILIGFSNSIETGILYAVIILILQFFESNVMQPLIIKNTLKLMPIETLAGVLLFGKLFGFVGMILAPLLIICIKILIKTIRIKDT